MLAPLALLALFALGGCSLISPSSEAILVITPTPSAVPLPRPLHYGSVAFIGDTLVAGDGSSSASDATTADARFPARLVADLRAHDASAAQSGRIILARPALRVQAALDALPADLPTADLTVIALGTYDVQYVEPSKTAKPKTDPFALDPNDLHDRFRLAYRTLLHRVVAAGSGPRQVACLSVWRVGPEVETYNGILKEECLNAGGVYVNLSRASTYPFYLSGPLPTEVAAKSVAPVVLPNSAGQDAIAQTILEELWGNQGCRTPSATPVASATTPATTACPAGKR